MWLIVPNLINVALQINSKISLVYLWGYERLHSLNTFTLQNFSSFTFLVVTKSFTMKNFHIVAWYSVSKCLGLWLRLSNVKTTMTNIIMNLLVCGLWLFLHQRCMQVAMEKSKQLSFLYLRLTILFTIKNKKYCNIVLKFWYNDNPTCNPIVDCMSELWDMFCCILSDNIATAGLEELGASVFLLHHY